MTPQFGPLFGEPTSGVNKQTASYAAQASDAGRLISFASASAAQLSLPVPPLSSDWVIFVQNVGAGNLTVSPGILNLDGAVQNLTVLQNKGVAIWTDGTNYYTFRGM